MQAGGLRAKIVRIKLSSFLAPFVSVFVFLIMFVFATFFSSLSSWGVLVPLELLPLLLEFGVSSFYKMVFYVFWHRRSTLSLVSAIPEVSGSLGTEGRGRLILRRAWFRLDSFRFWLEYEYEYGRGKNLLIAYHRQESERSTSTLRSTLYSHNWASAECIEHLQT